MAYQRWWKTVRDQQGNAVNGANCAVYNGGTGTLATVYDPNTDDSAPGSLANPFTTTANGVFGFMAADGEYDVQISGGAFATQQFRVVLNGFVSGSAATLAADLAATTGAGLVGTPAGTVQSKLDSLTTATSTTIPAAFVAADAVVTAAFQAADTALDTRLDAVEVGQSSAVVGYDTQANLYANLVPIANSVGYVMNDPTPAKNGTYRKVGGTGTGSWVQSSYDRVALVEAQAASTEVSWLGDGARNYSYLKKLSASDTVLRRTDWQGTWDLSSATRRIINKYSEPLLANFYQKSGTITQGNLTDHGLSNGATYPAAAQLDYSYLQTGDTILSATPYAVTIFVKMADLSKPRVGTTTAGFDFCINLGGIWPITTTGIVYTDLGSGLWRVDIPGVSVAVASQQFGVLRAATHSGKGFTVTGFYLTEGSTVTPYIKNPGATYLDVADYSVAVDGKVTTANTPEAGAVTAWVPTAFAPASLTPRVSTLEGQRVDLESVFSSAISIRGNGTNQFNRATALIDKTLLSTGLVVVATTWTTSDFMPVDPAVQYVFSRIRYVCQYDVHKKFIAGTYQSISPQAQTTITTDPAAAYVRATWTTLDSAVGTFEVGTTPSSYIAFVPALYLGSTKIASLETAVTTSTDLLTHPDYKRYLDREKFQVFKPTTGNVPVIRAILRNVAVQYKGTTISISTKGVSGPYDAGTVTFDATNFPNLIAGSVVENIFLLPWTRNQTTAQTGINWRMVVITDKGQVYHNYPSRAIGSDGAEVAGDVTKFDESVVWDLPVTERLFPSTNPAAVSPERYLPGLPAGCYTYHPAISTDNGYGNGGFGNSIVAGGITYPRFYVPSRANNMHSLAPMGGFEPGDKLTLIGTYRSNVFAGEATRVALFATSDGGRQWYCKYEFADNGVAVSMANSMDTSGLASAYTANSFVVSLRQLVVPSSITKEPTTKFTWGAGIVVSDISRANPGVVTTATPHGLTSGNIVVIADNPGSGAVSPDWDWMRNETTSATSGGNGVLFKVQVLSPTTFSLYEHVHSAQNALYCRHIHHINRVKDGWIMGTGEEYPGGWTFFIKMQEADIYSVVNAWDARSITRLTSTSTSIQRTLGIVLRDDATQTVLAAMDSATVPRGTTALPTGRTDTISRNSTGVYRGTLANIDDLATFIPVFEAEQPAYYLKEKSGMLMCIGQRGELGVSFDGGSTWDREDLGDGVSAQHFYGESGGVVVVDQYVIVKK